MEIKEILNEQRIYAVINKVPILRESEVHLFEELIDLYQPHRILEVGTAIGYSTLLLAQHAAKDGEVVSLIRKFLESGVMENGHYQPT